MDSKYNEGDASKVGQWIDAILGISEVTGHSSSSALHEKLKNGILLCRVMNELQPGIIKKFNESKMAFKMMENIGKFLEACKTYGVANADLFQTVDLYECQNMAQVVTTIIALAVVAQAKGVTTNVDFGGVKKATENKREFTEEQLKEGQKIIGLQMGTNKMASQQGMTGYGTGRQIINKN